MKIVIIGAGHMGAWLAEELAKTNQVYVYDKDPAKLKLSNKVTVLKELQQLKSIVPEMLLNCVALRFTKEVFDEVLPYLTKECLLSDIMSVKNDIKDFYLDRGVRFVSTHPMFGPTFADINDLKHQNAILIQESDEQGKAFFRDFYQGLDLNIYEYSFKDHDERTAYSLATPFASTITFAASLQNQEAPGTTFKKHMDIAKGLLSEDDYLISEILFNPNALRQIERINSQLAYLTHIIKGNDHDEMKKFLNKLRANIT